MKGKWYLILLCLMMANVSAESADPGTSTCWQAPFGTSTARTIFSDTVLTFRDVLQRTVAANPTVKSVEFERRAAVAELQQAGLWPNPEIGLEFQEVGWDAPGFRESEITLFVAQEFEIFGQRGARHRLARAEIEAAEFRTRVAGFDLYLEAKRRFYILAHAQQRLQLAGASVELATNILRSIRARMEKGAMLQSELLLAELTEQRARLELDQAQQENDAAAVLLAALWNGSHTGIVVDSEREPDLESLMGRVSSLEFAADSTRAVLQLRRLSALTRAQQSVAVSEARPGITLSGGLKRFEGDKSNSFLIGVSMPLTILNRNQGTRQRLKARLRSLDYQIDRERLDAEAMILAHSIRLRQLVRRHDVLDSLLLPTSHKVYETLRQAYESGRTPYTELLEAERSLNELSAEHNDLLLAIHQQVIALEGLTGVSIRIDKEN